MARKRYSDEDILLPLREIELNLSSGSDVATACTSIVGVQQDDSVALRHAYGAHAAMTQVPINRIKSWLGHASLDTTEIYLGTAGAEDRQIAERMWDDA